MDGGYTKPHHGELGKSRHKTSPRFPAAPPDTSKLHLVAGVVIAGIGCGGGVVFHMPSAMKLLARAKQRAAAAKAKCIRLSHLYALSSCRPASFSSSV